VDLQDDPEFQSLGVQLVSISPDDPEAWKDWGSQYGLRSPLLSDAGNDVAVRYGVMRWRVPPGAPVDASEPGHTFVLVGEDGDVEWIRDYGAAQNGGRMYVPPSELIDDMRASAAG
jgi:peroxiredoxin